MTMPTDDTVRRIKAELSLVDTPPWFPNLSPYLVADGWQKLDRDFGITEASYGTDRVLGRDPKRPRQLAGYLDLLDRDELSSNSIQVEVLPEEITQQWVSPGFRFFREEEIQMGGVEEQLKEAFLLLSRVPTMMATVGPLIRSLHILGTSDDQVDVSFTEPSMPFSIFVSVPGMGIEGGIYRIAEAILHEAMHLQLTFIEGFVPLAMDSDMTYFSPWRNEYRSPLGVVHALYVFRVIDSFFKAILSNGPVGDSVKRHALKRREEIAQQIKSICDFKDYSSLTTAGTGFVSRMLG